LLPQVFVEMVLLNLENNVMADLVAQHLVLSLQVHQFADHLLDLVMFLKLALDQAAPVQVIHLLLLQLFADLLKVLVMLLNLALDLLHLVQLIHLLLLQLFADLLKVLVILLNLARDHLPLALLILMELLNQLALDLRSPSMVKAIH
jgi:hypothetical protein